MAMQVGPEFLVDEAIIVASHDRMIASDDELTRHLKMINLSLECLSRLPEFHVERDEAELNVLRLGTRCFNSGASSLRLLRCGYFQPAVTMMRDLIEIYFLMDLFVKEPQSLNDWLYMDEKDRRRNFKPVRVRQRLDELDGFTGKKRETAYNMFSQLAAHVNPNGHHLISPSNETRIGPFPDYSLFKAGMEELVTHLSFATVVFCNLLNSDNQAVLRTKEMFLSGLSGWKGEFFGSKSSREA